MRRIMMYILFLVALLCLLCLPASAAEGIIRIHTQGQGEVFLYRVGILEQEHFRLTDEHGGGTVTFDDVLEPELAAWLASRATGGISRETIDGVAEFTGLSEGLYLTVQKNLDYAPFLIILPWDGDTWFLDVKPESKHSSQEVPQTGDRSIVVSSSLVMCASMIGLLIIGSRKKY